VHSLIAGTQEEGALVEPLCFWFSDAHRAILTATSRQELKTFTFQTDQQIGLEIEVDDGRVRIEPIVYDIRYTIYNIRYDASLTILYSPLLSQLHSCIQLCCVNVLPDCQASPHTVDLTGSLIVAVNGLRVL
jgi:hypothetical protein